ncbi:T9SS type A sorting domain-containing protein [bacterium BMS3Abin03]|nr:T9SS type A sorting domain-containing protein [bacterium BMS3Abin03]
MKNIKVMIILMIVLLIKTSLAQIIETKLVPINGQLNDGFGVSVASDGNYLVVGAPYNSFNPGYASVYENLSGIWTEKSKLQASDGYSGQKFGYSVSISGDFILIGAYSDDQVGYNAGTAYIFKRDSATGNWNEIQKLFASDSSYYSWFGYSVSLLDDHAIIGAPRYYNDSVETGAAYIYKWNGSIWFEETRLVPQYGVGGGQSFGNSVSIFGVYVIIGALGDEGLAGYPGAAYIFYNNGSNWIQQAKLNASDINLNHHFGRSVFIYEDYAAVGSINALTTTGGAVIMFHRNDTTWTEEAIIEGSSNYSPIDFGLSVSMDNDYLVVGAPDEETNDNHSGCAYIFKRDGINWTEQAKLLASDGSEDDKMGWSVFIEDDEAFIGAPIQEADNKYCGAVYVYTDFVTDVNQTKNSLVENFYLEQNYPNPFNPSTKIKFGIPDDAGNGVILVTLKVYDILGKEVTTLLNEEKSTGKYEIEFDGKELTSGIYFYKLKAGNFLQTKKMVFIK